MGTWGVLAVLRDCKIPAVVALTACFQEDVLACVDGNFNLKTKTYFNFW